MPLGIGRRRLRRRFHSRQTRRSNDGARSTRPTAVIGRRLLDSSHPLPRCPCGWSGSRSPRSSPFIAQQRASDGGSGVHLSRPRPSTAVAMPWRERRSSIPTRKSNDSGLQMNPDPRHGKNSTQARCAGIDLARRHVGGFPRPRSGRRLNRRAGSPLAAPTLNPVRRREAAHQPGEA